MEIIFDFENMVSDEDGRGWWAIPYQFTAFIEDDAGRCFSKTAKYKEGTSDDTVREIQDKFGFERRRFHA